MDFWEVLKVVGRRWVIVVPWVLLTVVGALVVPPRIDPTYMGSASTVVISPVNGHPSLNPYLAIGAPTMAQAIAVSADGAAAVKEVTDAGNSGNFTVAQQSSRSPILGVTAEASDPATAVATVEQVLDIIKRQLDERQSAAGAQVGMRYTSQDLTAQIVSTPVFEGARRVRFLIIGGGGLLAVTLALAVEGLAVYRTRRRATDAAATPIEERLGLIIERLALMDEKDRLLAEQADLRHQRTGDQTVDGHVSARQHALGNGAREPEHRERATKRG